MTKPLLIKKSFNGGELSPELHYRDDLAAYTKGCKHLDNMQATPYGAVTRRPPMELMARIDANTYGIPVKYIPFKFSLTEVFNIVFTDGSGSAGTGTETADVIIYDSEGELVELQDGVFILDTVYASEDLKDLHFINVNDFVYLTCGGNYPVQQINRYFSEADNANRWKIERFEMIGGPMLDVNLNTDQTINFKMREYSASESYSAGDFVVENQSNTLYSDAIRSIGYVPADATAGSSDKYKLWLDVGSAIFSAIEVGTIIRLFGIGNPVTGNVPTITHSGFVTVAEKNVQGSYNWLKTDRLFRMEGVYVPSVVWSYPAYTLVGSRDIEVAETLLGAGAYRSVSDGNLGNDLDNDLYWEGKSTYQGEVDLFSGFEFFNSDMIGSTLAVRDTTFESISGKWTSNQSSITFPCFGLVKLVTEGGAWEGNLRLLESKDNGTSWEEIGFVVSSGGASNGSVERNISGISSILKVELVDYVQQSGFVLNACAWRLDIVDPQYRFFRVLSVSDSRSAVGLSMTPVKVSVNTYKWARGAFSDDYGYPNALTIHDERMVFGGTKLKPNTAWASRVNDWPNFLKGDLETSPYTFTVASDSFDSIRSLKSSRQLNIFTDNQEATMGSREDSAVTSVSNIAVSSHTNYGSSNVQSVQMADMIWFAMGQSRRVRASRYDFASDGQQSIEMSLFANHITESGIKEMSFRRHPFNSLLCVLNNGNACSLTYEGAQDVQAWTPISTDGEIVSAYSNYSDKGDVVYGIVRRHGDYYLERFGSSDENTVYLDNFVRYENTDFTSGVTLKQGFTGNLVVIGDGDNQLVDGVDYTIVGGVLTIPGETSGNIVVGIPYTSRINPTDVTEYAPNGALRRLSALSLYLLNSGDCEVKINGKDSNFTAGSRLLPTERLNGRYEMTTGGGYDSGCDVDIYVRDHKPFTLIGLGYRMSANQ